ncbi:dihydroneopterin aldolase [Caminibacter sp.]
MYTIVIEELTFKAILGILEKERNEEQLVVVDCEISYPQKVDYVDYSKVCDVIQNMIIKNRYSLIEDAVDDIEKKLKELFPQMKELYLKITKPEILKNALVGVKILRKY